MHKTLLLTVFICLLFSTAFGAFGEECDPITNLAKKHMCRRFVKISYQSAEYYIDLKDVTSVVYDYHLHFAKAERLPSALSGKSYLVYLKGGKMFYYGYASSIKTYYENYINFLNDYPEFLSVP